MSELEGMINSVLSNPDEMKKIMEMASKLIGPESTAAPSVVPDGVIPSGAEIEKLLSGMNGMGGLASAAQGVLGSGDLGGLLSAAQSLLSSPTVQKLLNSQTVQNIISEVSRPTSDKHELVNALQPWISEKRCAKLKKAVVYAKVMRFAGAAAFKKGD